MSVLITREQNGELNGVPLTGRVFVTGPHFGEDIYSSTTDHDKASRFEPDEAERLIALGYWSNLDPRTEPAMTKQPDPFKGKIHVALGGPDCASTVCGLDPKKVNVVPPKLAQHATCKRCARSLRAL